MASPDGSIRSTLSPPQAITVSPESASLIRRDCAIYGLQPLIIHADRGAPHFFPGLKTKGNAAFVGLSAVGNRSRANCLKMQPSTRGFDSEELDTRDCDTSPPGVMPKLTVTPPDKFGSRDEAAS